MSRLGTQTHDRTTGLRLQAIEHAFSAAIAEATRHVGATAPNPPVGCTILDAEGRTLAVAAHRRAGEPHAEALALRLCREHGTIDQAATAIVTLEPCNHTGRTPPCSEAILASPIRTVWIGTPDPDPRVAGGGAARLLEAGIAVHYLSSGASLALDCAALIAPFARAVTGERPWITVKQALDAEGGMVPPAGARTFTGPSALALAHRLRRGTDAVITGIGTILADSPHFTVRHLPDHPGRRRVLGVLDRSGGLPDAYRREAEARGFLVRTAPDLATLLLALSREGVLWALVEAGPRLLARLAAEALWDDWLTIRQDRDGHDHVAVRSRAAVSPLRLIEGVPAPQDPALQDREAACSPAS